MERLLINALSATPPGEEIIRRIEAYNELVGNQLANGLEGRILNKDDAEENVLIGGGEFFAGVLTGVIKGRKGKGESKTVTMEPKKHTLGEGETGGGGVQVGEKEIGTITTRTTKNHSIGW